MTSKQGRKRKSEEMDGTPAAITPPNSPLKKMKITQTQKQALIDNLQLELTERARGLRAHYALQCADLRARIERRVNRIPIAMRKMTMGELIMRSQEAGNLKQKSSTVSVIQNPASKALPPVPQENLMKSTSPMVKSKKRKSSAIIIASDKEDQSHDAPESLAVSKNNKRAKTTTTTRITSQAAKRAAILSPKSHNSRTFPRSPIKDDCRPISPAKSYIARPVSPLKPTSPFKAAATAATSAISASVHGMIEHAKRGTAATAGKLSRTASREKTTTKMLPPPIPSQGHASSPQRTVSQASTHSTASEASTTSNGTTVVTKPKAGRGTRAAAKVEKKEVPKRTTSTKATAMAASSPVKSLPRKTTAASKKAAAAAPPAVAEPTTGRRVLRKRN